MKQHCCITVCVCVCVHALVHTYLSKNRHKEWSGLQFWHNTCQIVVTSSCNSQGRPVSTGEGHSFVGFCLFVKRIGETAPGAGVASVNLALHLCPDSVHFWSEWSVCEVCLSKHTLLMLT